MTVNAKAIEEAMWSTCASTGRVLHTLYLIRSASTPADTRADLTARLEGMLDEAFANTLAMRRALMGTDPSLAVKAMLGAKADVQ